jgi:hypothetical protein
MFCKHVSLYACISALLWWLLLRHEHDTSMLKVIRQISCKPLSPFLHCSTFNPCNWRSLAIIWMSHIVEWSFHLLKHDDDDDDNNNNSNNNNNNKRGRGWNEVENCLVWLVQCWIWNINSYCVSRKFIARAARGVTTVALYFDVCSEKF